MKDERTAIFKTLSHKIRVEIIHLLGRENKLFFKEILTRLNTTSEKLSFHLKRLREEGIIDQDTDGYYYLTAKGISYYNLINYIEQFIFSEKEKTILTKNMYGIHLDTYLKNIFSYLISSNVKKHLKRNIYSEIIESIYRASDEDYLDENQILLIILFILEKYNILKEKINYNIELINYDSFYKNLVYPIYRDDRLLQYFLYKRREILKFVANNFITYSLNPNSGIYSLHLYNFNIMNFNEILKKTRNVGELSFVLKEMKEITDNFIEKIHIAENLKPLTFVLDLENQLIEKFFKQIIDSNIVLNNTLFVLKIDENILKNKEIIKLLSTLLNRGYNILFTRSKSTITEKHIVIPDFQRDTLSFGSLIYILPIIFQNNPRRIDIDPLDFMKLALEHSLDIVETDLLKKAKETLRALHLTDVYESFQVSYAGFEAALLNSISSYRELIRDPKQQIVVLRDKCKSFFNEASKYIGEEENLYFTYINPYHHLNKLLGEDKLLKQTALYLHVNNFSPFSFNNRASLKYQHHLETSFQADMGNKAISIVEFRVRTRLSAFLLEDIFRYAIKSGSNVFTITVIGLKMCLHCGSYIYHYETVCPKCFSHDVSDLVRPVLKYVPSRLVDPFSLEEYRMRKPAPTSLFAQAQKIT